MTQVEIKITINTQDSDQITALNELFRAIGGNTKPKVETPTPEEKGIKIEDVRALTAKKVGSFRREIKAKLTELGAPNVTSLDESLYGTFMNFLNDLK